jgi:hypothetical protein
MGSWSSGINRTGLDFLYSALPAHGVAAAIADVPVHADM